MSAKLIIGDISDIQKRQLLREEYISPTWTADSVERNLRREFHIPDEAVCKREPLPGIPEDPPYVIFRFTWYEVTL
jgi:hypothetical protein